MGIEPRFCSRDDPARALPRRPEGQAAPARADTYLRFAEAVARADIARERGVETADRAVGGWLDGERRKAVTKGAIDGVMEALGFGDTRQ